MTTKTQDVIAAIKAKLVAASITVRDDTDSLYSFENKPVIVIDCGNENPDPVVGQGYVYWNLAVTLWVGADGPEPKLAPEPTRQAAHAALYADRTLGGIVIDIMAGAVNRHIDQDNPAAGVAECIYQVKYRALESTV